MFCMLGTHPSLTHVINAIFKISNYPNEAHCNAMCHILCYLNDTTTFGLCYVVTNTNNHVCISCKENTMVGSGSLLYLNQGPNSWFLC
jgi:hypothetical protein